MGMGAVVAFTKTMASAGTLTGEYDLGRSWENVYLVVPSMTSNSQIHIQASESTGGTYRRLYHPSINSSTVGTNVFAVPSAVTNAHIPIPNGFRYLKVETTATIDSACIFKIICGD